MTSSWRSIRGPVYYVPKNIWIQRRRSKKYEEFPSYEDRYDYHEERGFNQGYSPGYSPIGPTNHERSYRSESRGSRCRSEQSRHSRSSSSRYSSHRAHSRINEPEYEYHRRRRQEHRFDDRHDRRNHDDRRRRRSRVEDYGSGWFSPSAGLRDDRRSRRRDHLAHFGFEMDGQTRETIRKIAFSTLVASGKNIFLLLIKRNKSYWTD